MPWSTTPPPSTPGSVRRSVPRATRTPLAQLLHLRPGGDYVSWKGIRSLPKLDFASEQVQDAVYRADNAILRYWMRAPYQIDGWRFDVIHMLGSGAPPRQPRPRARHSRRGEAGEPGRLRARRALLRGEPVAAGDQEDGAMNYHGFAHPVRAFLAGQDIAYHPIKISATELDHWLKLARAHIPFKNQLAQFNLLDSHDTARFLHLLGRTSSGCGSPPPC